MMPQRVGTGTSSGHGFALSTAWWWHIWKPEEPKTDQNDH
jgi:hypothetical protein